MWNWQQKENRLLLFLTAFFVSNALVAEFIGIKIFSVEKTLGFEPLNFSLWGIENLSINMSAGIINWPLVFIMTDLVNEYYGYKGVRALTRLAIFFIAYAFGIVYLAIYVAPADIWTNPQLDLNQAFKFIFGQGMWNIFASLSAFAVSQWIDVMVFHLIRRKTGERRLWLRATGSTVFSQLIDSFIVTFILFYFNPNFSFPFWQVFVLAVVGYSYKFIVALATTPFLYLSHAIIERYLGKTLAHQMKLHAAQK
ncbi:MAG: queuosine precursor transporter [Bacteroidales bacterium]|nr:queuosine precursor transporter [Bacteroidales bacterium]